MYGKIIYHLVKNGNNIFCSIIQKIILFCRHKVISCNFPLQINLAATILMHMSSKVYNNIKIVYVLLDGVGDLPHPSLNDLTPLEAAYTPHMDSLSRNGCMGQVITVGKGIAPQSDIAVFNMLGYNFKNGNYVGRGVIESIGCNIDFKEGDVAMRGNFATVNDNLQIIDRRAGRIISKEEAASICGTLNEKIRFSDKNAYVVVEPTVAHRVTIRFRHDKIKLSERITNTDPAYDRINGMGIAKPTTADLRIGTSEPQEDTVEAKTAAKLVNEFTIEVARLLKNHPVNDARSKIGKKPINAILARDSGNRYPDIQPINRKYGIDVACIVDMPVEIGISKVLGMRAFKAGDVNDYEQKAIVAAENLDKFNVIYVHIKGPDEFGHDGDAKGKKKNIEDIDRRFFATLIQKLKVNNPTIVVSADHSTPCIKKGHSDDPVPLLLTGNKVRKDKTARFTEKYASKGSMGLIMGADVLSTAIRMITS
jgi:2,3-bisphosphoglycerate-independent phosphoglycerate mutase